MNVAAVTVFRIRRASRKSRFYRAMLSAAAGIGAQNAPAASPDSVAYTVSYVEVAAAAEKQAIDALKRYREASRTLDGHLRVELFDQVGRPGHFAIFEAWRDQKAI